MAGPVEELVARILRRVERFKEEQGLPEVEVRLELVDGSLHRLKTLSPSPASASSASVLTVTRQGSRRR